MVAHMRYHSGRTARSAQRAHNVKSTTPGRRSTPGGTTWLRALLHPRAVLLQRGPSPRKFTLLHVRTSMMRKTSWPLPARTRPCESSDYSASKCANGHIILYRAAHYPGVLRLGWGAGAWRILWGEGGPLGWLLEHAWLLEKLSKSSQNVKILKRMLSKASQKARRALQNALKTLSKLSQKLSKRSQKALKKLSKR